MPRVTTTKSTGKILAKGVEILNENVRGETNKKVSERILDLSRKGIEAVSYTHLDVYKRQILGYYNILPHSTLLVGFSVYDDI